MRRLPVLALVVACALGACHRHPDEPAPVAGEAGLTVKEVMREKMEPNAQIFWHSSGEVDTDKGTIDLAPTTPEGWKKAEDAVDGVIAAGRLLTDDKRAKGRKDFVRHAEGLIEEAKLAREAVRARNKDKMFETGGDLYGKCTDCHKQYLLPLLGPDGRPKKIDENGSPIINK
jgi:hypothetical protein